MKPKRIFQVYESELGVPVFIQNANTRFYGQRWRWRLIAARNGQIVGGSQEAFDNRGNALRAARREASLYPPGVAAVEIEGQGK